MLFDEMRPYASGLPADLRGIIDGKSAFCGPEHVVIDLTNACNLRCIGCWTYSPLLKEAVCGEWMSETLSYKAASALIDDLADMGTKRIRFTGGGEPLLHRDIRKLISRAKKKGLICAVTTNLSIADEEMAVFLCDAGLDDLAVSIWAHDPEEYALMHPGSGEDVFTRVIGMLQMISRARKHGRPRILICNVLTVLNYQSAYAMFELAVKSGADAVYFTLVDVIGSQTDSLLLNQGQRDFLIPEFERMEKMNADLPADRRIEIENLDGIKKRLSCDDHGSGEYDVSAVDEIPCYAGWMFARITASGDVSPCCRGVNLPMGNINRTSFKDIWDSERYSEFREKALRLKKSDPYFAKVGCYKTCDNLMHNRNMHQRLLDFRESLLKKAA